MTEIVIGVLALQGAFAKHIEMVKTLGVKTKEVRYPEDLDCCDGLIIPGGESTVIFKSMQFTSLEKKIAEFGKEKPIFGTCAGLILISKEIVKGEMKPLGFLDITVERNAYGRQIDSFIKKISVTLEKTKENFEAFFIRAPRIQQISQETKVLATLNDEPILVRQGFHLGATFHPELTNNPLIHLYFLKMVKEKKKL